MADRSSQEPRAAGGHDAAAPGRRFRLGDLKTQRRLVAGFLALAVPLGLFWELQRQWPDAAERTPPLTRILTEREIVVLTRNAPTTLYAGRGGLLNGGENLTGYEHNLVSAFADYLGVTPRFKVLETTEAILAALEAGEGDVAAAGLTATAARAARYRTGPAYKNVRQQVVCNRYGFVPDTIEELAEARIEVIPDSSYVERLEDLAALHPGLTWETPRGPETEQLLWRVSERAIDCTVADSNIVAINRRYHPELAVALDLTEPQPLAWFLPQAAGHLERALEVWFARAETRALLARLDERYYSHTQDGFDYVDMAVFRRRIESLLPRYLPWMKEAAAEYGLSWTLLAAVAYQESHWDRNAVSPTGVRGLMMLTRATARQLGIANRTDPRQSIFGGARYLAMMQRRVPDDVPFPDRLWFALAAYNVGFGHLMDARRLADRLGYDKTRWVDLKEVLPLLSQRKYYKDLRYGYARGREPVHYVENIRDYLDILERRFPVANPLSRAGTALTPWSLATLVEAGLIDPPAAGADAGATASAARTTPEEGASEAEGIPLGIAAPAETPAGTPARRATGADGS